MSRFQKTVLGFLTAVLVILCAWAWWEREIPLTDLLPDTAWTEVRLLAGDMNSQEREQELAQPPLEEILTAISEARVTRDTKNSHLDDNYFQLYLSPEEGYPTVIYVNQNGRIQIAAEMDLDHYQYYEGGESLYKALE
ncbi:MAG: hypothetical protein ACI4TY_00305, partial [Candidatus Limosilactobacillus intestinavium]